MKKRTLSFILGIVFCLSLTACEDKPTQSISSTEQVQEKSVPQTTMEEIKPDIPQKDISLCSRRWSALKLAMMEG